MVRHGVWRVVGLVLEGCVFLARKCTDYVVSYTHTQPPAISCRYACTVLTFHTASLAKLRCSSYHYHYHHHHHYNHTDTHTHHYNHNHNHNYHHHQARVAQPKPT